MHSAMTAATKRDQIPAGLTSEALVGAVMEAVMEVIAERPFDAANEAAWFGAVPLDPVRCPKLSERKPLLAGHVVAIGGSVMKATR